ncbi:MAG: diacylglycerol kinase family protein [Ferruginibacter sp.]
MKRKLLFFINPISGSGKNKKLIQVIQDVMEKQHMLYEIMDTLKSDYSPSSRRK